MKQHVFIERVASNQKIVSLWGVRLYFSYKSCIAFERGGVGWYNPTYRNHSVTTSKHATQMGCGHFQLAASQADFDARLAAALDSAAIPPSALAAATSA